jgi:hypothetical protein
VFFVCAECEQRPDVSLWLQYSAKIRSGNAEEAIVLMSRTAFTKPARNATQPSPADLIQLELLRCLDAHQTQRSYQLRLVPPDVRSFGAHNCATYQQAPKILPFHSEWAGRKPWPIVVYHGIQPDACHSNGHDNNRQWPCFHRQLAALDISLSFPNRSLGLPSSFPTTMLRKP